jgi:hypothetical protein
MLIYAKSFPSCQKVTNIESWKTPFYWWVTTECREGFLGFNTNKGSEIGLCVDGCPNELMHVLLHELAHATVKEYDHSPAFWKNLDELKTFAESKKLYKTIDDPKGFCGSRIHD